MEWNVEWNMEWNIRVKKTAIFLLEKKKDTCFDLFSLRTAARKEWRTVAECETRLAAVRLVQAAQPETSV